MILFCLGFISAFILHLIAMGSYKRTLQMVGEEGRSEKINGKWNVISREKE